MLPLVQRHHMVHHHVPTNIEPPFPSDHHHGPNQSHNHHHHYRHHSHLSFHARALHDPHDPHDPTFGTRHAAFPHPIPPPLSVVARLPPPRSADPSEHHLRRKTPNGTIDAGYDGAPAHLDSAPPPLKHMILPASSNPAAFTPSSQHDIWSPKHAIPPSTDRWAFNASLPHLDAHPSFALQPNPAHDFATAVALDCAPSRPLAAHHQPYSGPIRVPTALQPPYQQSPGPVLFQNGGVLPPPAWPETNLPSYAYALNSRLANPHGLHLPQFYPNNNHDPAAVFSVSSRGHYAPHPATIQVPFQRLESLTLDSSHYQPTEPLAHESPSPARFREKVLVQAHRSYVELLSYLHQNKKALSRTLGGSKHSSRMIILPKLPKSSPCPSSTAPPRRNPSELHYAGTGDARLSIGSRTDLYMGSQAKPLGELIRRNSEVASPPFYHVFHGDSPRGHDVIGSSRDRIPMTPLTDAKAAIEMLTHLCEQSDWKWVDGILLGGCLHYGLEHYEQSLEWFQRIVSLDANHIEALSNVAASFYCLGRLDEAESHWMQAIRRRPAYLEAVEHLVHLLCTSQRSKEAVEIIHFVQNSLRYDRRPFSEDRNSTECTQGVDSAWHAGQSATYTSHSDMQPGTDDFHSPESAAFGISGYSIPASENGRIIALIHAKGNMLYALKDMDLASEAFEEAVLISTGNSLQCIHSLIAKIHCVLSAPNANRTPSPRPLLLPPERARLTAQLVFGANGGLPGLRFVPDGIPKRSAISTTSNSLLSLAKIFQDAISTGGSYPRLLCQPPGVGDILALYYLSLSLSESPSTANNVGILLASIQHTGTTPPSRVLETSSTPQIPGIIPGSGLALALAYYNYGLNLDAKHVHLHTNLGSLLKDIGQLDMAIQMYERAVACDGNFDIALTNLANAVKDRGRISDAIMYYKRAVSSNPHFAEAVCGLSTALNSVCDWRGRGGIMLNGGQYDRWHVDDAGMLKDAKDEGTSSGLMKKVVAIVSRQLADSSQWGVGILQAGEHDSLVRQLRKCSADEVKFGLDLEQKLGNWSGRPWEGSRLLRLVERSIKTAMHRWYRDKYITGSPGCVEYLRPRLPAQLAVPAAPTVLPFHTFTCPLNARDIRRISQRNAARIACSTLRSPWLPNTVYPPPPPPEPQLNVGYISSDFNNHPLAHLMQSVFGFHSPQRTKAICYATTASDKSIHRQQIEREAPVFRDVSSWSAEQIVGQVVKDEIHILVNLNGYTRGARNEIFAARPAPIQMSFMGFAGTLGAEWCDYLLADETAIPPSTLRPGRNNAGLDALFQDEEVSDDHDWVYSENIIFCRDTFFCCDHAQSCSEGEKAVTWEDEQQRRWKMRKEIFPNLSDDTIIMGNFNQLYKIDPATLRTWLRILSNVPKAILWLLRFPELGECNLLRTARAWAGEEVAKRIVFTDVAPKQQHISRARVCDIFLDTPECNAHTTAADVLWSSTPLLTLPRYPYKMCSRMAASILKGALPKTAEGSQAARELIATDDADYEHLATQLAGGLTYERVDEGYCEGRGRLAELRKMLFEAKWTCPLFDTHRWVSDLESAYEEAWRRWVAGEGGDIYL
ncbi:glycosyltransferase family 41 protein [Xylariaceae sp. FL0255]|nr:glycosyltransferase family 41 protein [Xylariaceae sp. FL0255]